ncbi:adenylyl-sulfate kinase [candidate division KSB1 bacterium]|nr:adenylyl-sulfate kinase [candidate division KSB1 bacterium]MBL7095888.1 adenylyl-sulfate kinase [candidate division KSB1 bacterium]
MTDPSPPAHGGGILINRTIPEMERDTILASLATTNGKVYHISDADLSIFYRIADGALSPLEGPMNADIFFHVLEEEFIKSNGKKYAWTIPIAFPIAKDEAEKLEKGETVLVENSIGEIIGTLEISDIYPFDKAKYNRSVYGTERTDHPGARIFNDDPRDFLLGGKVWAFPQPKNSAFGNYMLTPNESRALFLKRGWERIVAFQTRNALHRAHEYALLYAAEVLTRQGYNTGAVLNPLVGATKSDDVPAGVRMETYQALIASKEFGKGDMDEALWQSKGYGFEDKFMMIGLDMKMFYAGPKEAIMHSIYRQNYGFTNIVIGRKHADAPYDDGTPIWGDFDAHDKFDNLAGELKMEPVKVGFASYFEEIERVGLIEEFKPKGYHPVFISGKEVRQKLQSGENVDSRIMRKPVADILRDFYAQKQSHPERQKSSNVTWFQTGLSKQDREKRYNHKGVVLWLTGLSACGKSTIATVLQNKLYDRGCLVYILDGDNIRHGLNGDLGFSPEDRDENIRRIGEVAHLFADAGFIAITSFISPYRKDRDRARKLNPEGEFIETYVKASLEVCESRDPKGLYKKAREGIIPEFTGISAPYEEPENAEVVVDTGELSVDESVDKILEYLEGQKILFEK